MIENTVLSNLVFNEDYFRKVYPYIKTDYFEDNNHKKIFETYSSYVEEYRDPPSVEVLKLTLDKRKDLNEESYKSVMASVDTLKRDNDTDQEWLVKETEKFCQDRDLYNAIRKAILVVDGSEAELGKDGLPALLQDSLSISFDSSVGHDYLEDYESRYDFYHKKEERIPFDIELLNKITKGGLPRKSMTVLLATTGGGKSLVKCHAAASALLAGKNVLYITMEMAEEKIAERIDANLMDLPIQQLETLSKDVFSKKIQKIATGTIGKLIIKQYPTGSAHSGHFRALLNEMKMKKKFIPDMIYIDYLNICSSSRMKAMGGSINSYTYIKAIAEELRGLAIEFDVPIMTATQTTRSGFGNTDVGLEDTSESFGLPATADLMFALIATEELDELNQVMVKQLKNRYNDVSKYKRFVIGIDRARMKLYDVEESAQSDIMSDMVIPDKPIATWGNNDAKDTFAEFKV